MTTADAPAPSTQGPPRSPDTRCLAPHRAVTERAVNVVLADQDDDQDDDLGEFDVIASCIRAVDTLDDITRDRVVRWLHAHYVEQAR